MLSLLCGALLSACAQLKALPVLDRSDGELEAITDSFLVLDDTQEHEITRAQELLDSVTAADLKHQLACTAAAAAAVDGIEERDLGSDGTDYELEDTFYVTSGDATDAAE